jgi:hypothetical protein
MLAERKLSPLSVSGIFTSEVITAIYPTPVTIQTIFLKKFRSVGQFQLLHMTGIMP